MPISLRVALFGGVVALLSMAVVLLAGFHVVTVSNAVTNFLGASIISGLLLMTGGLIKGL